MVDEERKVEDFVKDIQALKRETVERDQYIERLNEVLVISKTRSWPQSKSMLVSLKNLMNLSNVVIKR